MNEVKSRFTNNIRTIFFIVLVVACFTFMILKRSEINLPTSYIFFSLAMAAPITALGVNLNGLLAIKKVKDISSSERRRLMHIANSKALKLKQCIIFYIVAVIVLTVSNAFGLSDVAKMYATSAMIGLIGAAIYSVIISFNDNKKISDFEAVLQDRANSEAMKIKFQEAKVKK